MMNSRLNRRRLMAASSASLVSAAFLAACGGGDDGGGGDSSSLVTKNTDTTKTAQKGGTLGYFQNADPQNFDPYFARSSSIRTYSAYPLYQRLLGWKVGPVDNLPSEFVGDAAESFELAPDGLTMTFKLRSNNKFDARPPTNSRAMTSDDVKWSWEAYGAGANSTNLDMMRDKNKNAPIERLEFPDKNTVVAKMWEANAAIQTMFAFSWNFSILPVEADGRFDRKLDARGSGPFILSKGQPGVAFDYVRNPNYWNAANRPFLDGFTWTVIPDSSQILAQLKAGRLWYYESPAADQVLITKQDVPELNLLAQSPFNTKLGGYHLNVSKLDNSPFKDVRIRQAISMLIDRDSYNDTFGDIQNMEANGISVESGWDTHVPVGWPGDWLDPKAGKVGNGSQYFKFNPEEATKMLKAANFYGTEFTHSYIGSGGVSNDWYRKSNEVIMAMLSKDGILKPKANLVEATVYSKSHNNAQGQFEGTAFNPVSGQPDMTMYIASEFMPGGAHNYGWSKEYLGAAFDLAEKQKRELDYDKRQAITHDWEKAMAENMPTIPVQGERSWTQFSFGWPKLQNYKGIGVNGPDGTYGVLYENYWYDKSKDKA
jgi:peptide/nickel transport system substrate-binding protein